jgi:hypothetical protein
LWSEYIQEDRPGSAMDWQVPEKWERQKSWSQIFGVGRLFVSVVQSCKMELRHLANVLYLLCLVEWARSEGKITFSVPKIFHNKLAYTVSTNGLARNVCIHRSSARPWTDVMITIFGDFWQLSAKKLAFFSKTNVMIKIFQNLALFWVKNGNFFAEFFGENI